MNPELDSEQLAQIAVNDLMMYSESREFEDKIREMLIEFYSGGYTDAIGCGLWKYREQFQNREANETR